MPEYTTDRHVIGQAANGTQTIYDAAGRAIGTDRVSGLVITVTQGGAVASAVLTNPGTVYSTSSQILNAAGQVLGSTGPDGQTTTFTYNALGQQIGSTLPNGGTTGTAYDALGRKVSQTDSNGLTTSYVYDAAGDLVQTNYADGTSTLATYDGVGNKTASTDQMNQVTTYAYNVAGQILTVTEPKVPDPANNNVPTNPVTTYVYDQFGDEIMQVSPAEQAAYQAWLVAGNTAESFTGPATRYTFDQFGSQVSKTLPMGQVASTTYDGFGRTLTATDAAGRVTLYVYDNNPLVPTADRVNLGRLYGKYYFATTADYQAYIADPAGSTQPNETIVYAYNALGLETGITDTLITPAAGDPRSPYTNVTTFAYDSNNNVVQESGPSGTINYVYNQATQRHTETWTGTSYANAVSDIVYGYNSMGELASVTVVKESGVASSETGVASTQYDAIGGTSTTNLPNTVYAYDFGGRLETTFDSVTGITTTYTYKPNTNYVSTETVTTAAGAALASYAYSYRNDGLKTGETDVTLNIGGTTTDTRTLTWNYDGLDRLTQEKSIDSTNTALNYTDNYTYDLNSNRISETEDQGNTGSTTDTITSTYNANNELTQAVDANTGTTVYGYDANGSQTSVTHTPNGTTTPDTTTTNEYDLQGQLAGSQVTTSAGTAKTAYYCDDSGNRIEEVTVAAGSTTPVATYYLVDVNNPTGYSQPIEQASTPGAPQVTYIWGAQLISETYATGATIPGVGTASSPTTYYLFQDAHGSTRLATDSTGKAVQEMNYDAFGNALGFSAATALTAYLYSSMPFDAASGNYYDHARFYSSGTGEFTQSDYGYAGSLANPMSDLPYAFTGGDPINMLDLSGHDFSIADTLSFESISNFLDTGLGYVNTAFKVYNTAQNLIRVVQYAQFAMQVVEALAGAPTLGAAEDAVGAAITSAFPDFEIGSLSAGFSAAYNVLAKDWEQISKAIEAKIPAIAEASTLYAAGNLAGWMNAYEEGRLKFIVYGPSAPSERGNFYYLNIGKELQLALSPGGGRLFGFGIRSSANNVNQIFRIDYWENRQVSVHYHVAPEINGGGIWIWGAQP